MTQNDPLSGKLGIPLPSYHRCLDPHSEVSSCNLIPRITRLGKSFPKEVTSTQSVKVFKTKLTESHIVGNILPHSCADGLSPQILFSP